MNFKKVFKVLSLCTATQGRIEQMCARVEKLDDHRVRMYASDGYILCVFPYVDYVELRKAYKQEFGFELPEKPEDTLAFVNPDLRRKARETWTQSYSDNRDESLPIDRVRVNVSDATNDPAARPWLSFDETGRVGKIYKILGSYKTGAIYDRWVGPMDPVEFGIPGGYLVVMPVRG